MKTIKEIKNYRRKCAELNIELERAGITKGDPAITAFLSALDWVLMPSQDKKELPNLSELVVDTEIENRIKKLGLATCKCAKCGQEIFWIKTKKGKFAPITLQLINHFADCKFAEDFRKNGQNRQNH